MEYHRQMIVDYLDSYRPELFLSLEESGGLDFYVDAELDRLYQTRDQISHDLKRGHPEMSTTQVLLEAERAAIELLLEF